jgi:hypothetical protein
MIIVMLIAIGYVDVIDDGPPAGGGGPKVSALPKRRGSLRILQKILEYGSTISVIPEHMIRKTISCVLAVLLTVVPALALLLGHWQPGSGIVVLGLLFISGVGAVWLGSEVKEIFQKKKLAWEEQYAQTIYDGLVAHNDFGDPAQLFGGGVTALKLRIPTALHHAYQNKMVLQRELICFAALMSVAKPESKLPPVMLAYGNLLVQKTADRGLQMTRDQLAQAALDDVEVMIADPYKWAQRWLSEFRDDPNDTFMVAIFADHCMRLFGPIRVP